jgi:O-antigen/teichoic acid export membrane protein
MSLFDRLRDRLEADPRLARMLHGGASGLLSRFVALAISFITLPLTVRYLGKEEYGVWVTVATTVVMLSVLDLGIANTLTNFISESFAVEDSARAQRYYATAFWVTVGVALTLGVLAVLLFHILDIGALLHLSGKVEISHARTLVAISIAYFLLTLPLNLADNVLSGYQQVHVANYFQMINSVLGLLAIVTVMMLHGNIVVLLAAFCSAMLLGALGKQIWLSGWSKPWIRPHPSQVHLEIAHELFRQGILFFILQLTGLVVFNSDNLVITHFLGPSEVTPYSIAWRLTGYASLLQSQLIPSFWPAFTEAYKKQEMDWVRHTYRTMVRNVTLVVAAAALLIGLVGRPFIRIWAGPAAEPKALLLWTMAAWAILVATTTNQALLLTAVGRLRLETTVAVLAAVANLALSLFLVQRIGAEGVIVSTVVSFAIFMVVPQEIEVRRVLRGDFLEPLPFDSVREETKENQGQTSENDGTPADASALSTIE